MDFQTLTRVGYGASSGWGSPTLGFFFFFFQMRLRVLQWFITWHSKSPAANLKPTNTCTRQVWGGIQAQNVGGKAMPYASHPTLKWVYPTLVIWFIYYFINILPNIIVIQVMVRILGCKFKTFPLHQSGIFISNPT